MNFRKKTSDALKPDIDLSRTGKTIPSSLTPVLNADALKDCVIDTIREMDVNGNTHKYCLYILRALNDPDIISEDIAYFDGKAALIRQGKNNELKVKYSILFLMGLGIALGVNFLASWLFNQF